MQPTPAMRKPVQGDTVIFNCAPFAVSTPITHDGTKVQITTLPAVVMWVNEDGTLWLNVHPFHGGGEKSVQSSAQWPGSPDNVTVPIPGTWMWPAAS